MPTTRHLVKRFLQDEIREDNFRASYKIRKGILIRIWSQECQYLNQLWEDLKIISFYETKCTIRFIKVRFNCKSKKKWGKRMDGNYVHWGGRGFWRFMENSIKNLYFSFWNPSLKVANSLSMSLSLSLSISLFTFYSCVVVYLRLKWII